jgi:serine/threonine protein kinase
MPPRVGQTVDLRGSIGRVYIERKVAEGAFATIYAVYAQRFRGPYVLKCIALHVQSRQAIEREVSLQRRAAGPFVIAARRPTYTRTHAYFLLTYGSAGSLEAMLTADLAQQRPTPIADILLWFSHMVLAVQQCHARQVIHGDIKPENFVLTGGPARSRMVAKLTDFGLAATFADPTRAIGTITYMAPELLRGQGTSVASDVWSLGASLYRMLVGIEPYYDDNAEAVALRLLQRQPQFGQADLAHSLVYRGASDALRQSIMGLVAGLMHFDPAQRIPLDKVGAAIRLG